MKKNVAIAGGSGYTGVELTKILSRHPGVHLKAVSSESNAGNPLSTVMGAGAPDLNYCPIESDQIDSCDVIFSCLPHGTSAKHVVRWRKLGRTVFDLSADFRLKDKEAYHHWYHHAHPAAHLLKDAVYGLPELHKEQLKKADLISCPGCYPTATILGALPALVNGIVKPEVFVSAISGTSGAGKQTKLEYSFCEVNENVGAYAFPNHRHTPEMEQELSRVSGTGVTVSFVPHLGPFNRGIYATLGAELIKSVSREMLMEMFADFFASAKFVTVLDRPPQLRDVRGTNYCLIRPVLDPRTNRLVVFSVVDNLIKGAGGQAVQCFNIRFDHPETEALNIGPS